MQYRNFFPSNIYLIDYCKKGLVESQKQVNELVITQTMFRVMMRNTDTVFR